MLAQPSLSEGLTLYANGCFRVTPPPPPCTFNSHYRCQKKITNVCFLRVGKTRFPARAEAQEKRHITQ